MGERIVFHRTSASLWQASLPKIWCNVQGYQNNYDSNFEENFYRPEIRKKGSGPESNTSSYYVPKIVNSIS